MKKLIEATGLAVLIWSVLVSPIAVLAATGSTDINGEIPQTISITVPSTINLGTLVPEVVMSTAQTVTVDSNLTGWSLNICESGTSPDGKMARTSDAYALTAAMDVKGGDQTTYTSLSSTVILEDSSTVTSATINNILFRQYVVSTDKPGTYSITVVFTVTAGV